MRICTKLHLLVILTTLAGFMYAEEQTFDKGNIISQEDLSEFYEYWFDDPYDYMFRGEYLEFDPGRDITINGRRYRNYLAGINGIMIYGGLKECMANYLDIDGSYGFWDNDIIEIFAGLPVYRFEEAFGYYNPDIIIWGYTYLIPDPENQIYGETFQEVYDVLFCRFFRLMTESYVSLNDQNIYEAEQEEYYRIIIVKEHEAIDYLNHRFGEFLPQYKVYRGTSPWTVGMSYGFWLRRGIDGTHEEFWTGLKKVMVLYDEEWFEELERQYPGFAF